MKREHLAIWLLSAMIYTHVPVQLGKKAGIPEKNCAIYLNTEALMRDIMAC
jgi:hypothetical protein